MSSSQSPVPLQSANPNPPIDRSLAPAPFMEADWAWFTAVMRRFDQLAAGLLLIVTFLLALTPARNSDVWLHLATGRALLSGSYHFGADPFAFTTTNQYWVNQNWLLDVVSFVLYRAFGGAALILVKALLVTLLGFLLLRLGTISRLGWHQVVAAALAVLCIGPRLGLQPAVLSYVLFAAVWYFMERPIRMAGATGATLRWQQFWPVLGIMFIWANLDGWFVLGLLLIGVLILPEAVVAVVKGKSSGVLKRLVCVLLAAVAVCLLNPHHFHVFALPPELRVLGSETSYPYQALDLSPLQSRYYGTSLAHSVGGVVWLVLLGLSALALILNSKSPSGPRHWLLWVIFLLLGLLQARAIPFFAIIAGPILAIHWQEWAERYWGRGFANDVVLRASFSFRAMTLLIFLCLPVVAWAGWLQPKPYEPRGWAIEVDRSLQEASTQWHSWRETGRIPASERCWNSSVDVAHYLAWFGQGEQSFLDSRYSLFDDNTKADYLALHSIFTPSSEGSVLPVLRQRQVHYLIIHGDATAALNLLLKARYSPNAWSVIYENGSVTIGFWHDGTGLAADVPVWQPERYAYDPKFARLSETEGSRPPRLPDWKDPFVREPLVSNPDRDEASLMLWCFDFDRVQQAEQFQPLWKTSLAAALVTPGGVGTASPALLADTALRLSLITLPPIKPDQSFSLTPAAALALHLGNAELASMDEASPSWLFLAIRAARRAVQAAPEDALAWQLLGDAYQRLYEHTSERAEYSKWFGLRQLRSAQVIAAWQQALKLNPQLDSTRWNLANLYQRLDQPELALPLFQQLLFRQRRSGPMVEAADEFQARMQVLGDNIAALERSVNRKRELHEANAANLNVEDRASDAVQRGLAQQALETMLGADVASFGRPGLNMEMELLLVHGRVFDVRDWFTEDFMNLSTELDYRWIRARMYAATGDYAAATAALERLAEISFTVPNGPAGTGYPAQMSSSIARVLLQALNSTSTPINLFQSATNRIAVFKNAIEQIFFLRQCAEFEALRGLLALEAGDIPLAAQCFRSCTAMWGSEEAERTGAGIDFNGRRLAQHYLQLIEAAGR
jgi:hypothetical protein